MGNKDQLYKDDVSSYTPSASDMQLYATGNVALSRFQAPALVHNNDPHERLYVASFDGTGNDKFKDPAHETNVGKVADQIFKRDMAGDHQIEAGYLPGPGTQDNTLTRTLDGALGYTHERRVEKMYELFIRQAKEWLGEDPHAQIRLADIGFSRGAEEAASFARLVHERGIQDPSGAVYTRDTHGNITHVEYTKPPLMEPGQVAQAVGLFDAVGTGDPVAKYDRRLPPSVISGVQIFSKDEHRGLFKSDHIIDPGLSADGRFLGIYVPGAHSDVGGGYLLNGLSTRSGNLMIDYLNALSDQPYLAKSPEPSDPAMNVVHRSTEGMLLYRVWNKIDRTKPEGYNTLEAPRHLHHGQRITGDPYNAEPRDEALSGRFDFRPVTIGPVPVGQASNPALAATGEPAAPPTRMPAVSPEEATCRIADASVDAMVERLYQAAVSRDDRAMDAVTNDYLQSMHGAAWWREIQQGGLTVPPPALATSLQEPARHAPAMAMER